MGIEVDSRKVGMNLVPFAVNNKWVERMMSLENGTHSSNETTKTQADETFLPQVGFFSFNGWDDELSQYAFQSWILFEGL